MNLVLFDSSELEGDQILLEGRRASHIHSVHRATEGRRLKVGLIGGSMGEATVTSVDRHLVRLRIDSLDTPPPPPLPLILVLALPRPKVVNRTLAAAASLGIKRIEIINAWRVDKSYWSTPRLEPGKLRDQLLLGLEQGVDTILPEVRVHRFFRRFIEDELSEIAKGSAVLVAHPHASRGPRKVEHCVLVVGPEGGFIEDELRLLAEHGAASFRAGSRVLRVETAVPWLVALTVGAR